MNFILSRVECSLKHSSSVDDIKSDQRYWQKRIQLRHSCTGENNMISFKISNETGAAPQLKENHQNVPTKGLIESFDKHKLT